ncbi:MAG TPA: cache domain-containing protein, partial [Segetibacter sp.]
MKFFTFNKSHTSVFVTLLFVVFVGSLYFFIYLPQNEKRVQEQRFRSLQTIDNNIHAKIDNSIALMNNLLSAYQRDSAGITEYVRSYSKEKFTLTDPATGDSKKLTTRDIQDSGYIITVNNTNQLITLKLQKQKVVRSDTTFYQMTMQLTFDQFIRFLLPENVFDQYVVFSKQDVVYETLHSGITSLGDTVTDKSISFSASTVRSINAGGTDYKLFLQPVNFTADQKWVLGGLLNRKRYQEEKNKLPSNAVLLLVTVMLVIIVAFPWIKLYQMGNKDRLTISDGIASIVVAMLLMSLLFFSFFKYNRYLRPVDSPDSKQILAQQINAAFENEVDNIYNTLRLTDSFVSSHPDYFRNISGLHKPDSELKVSAADSLIVPALVAADTSISQVFWLKENGDEALNWTAADMNAPYANFKNRDYFKKIVQNKGYLLHNDLSKPYYLDQVISWTSGKFTSVLSVPSVKQGQSVAAMSFNMRSLNQPVLPTGYHFAIIDNSAKVLYHSDISHNLNENLLTEFSSDQKLTSCMMARTEDVFKTKYFSKEYNVLFKPLKKLPYSIIIFSDLDYKAARDLEIYSFTIAMLMLLFSTLILQLSVVVLLSSKRSFFKKQLFDTSWIGPKSSSHTEYNIAVLFNVVIIFLVVTFFNISAFLAYVYILLFSVTFISVFLNALFYKRYRVNKQVDNRKFKEVSLFGLGVFILILNITALKTLDKESTLIFFFYELLSLAVARVFYSKGDLIVAKILTAFN